MFVECVGYFFVGGGYSIVKCYLAVGVGSGWEFIVHRFYCCPVCVLVEFMVPVCIDMFLPYFLFLVREVAIYFCVESRYLWIVWIAISEVISVLDFGWNVSGDGFVSFVYVAARYEFLVSLDDGIGDEFGFL